jgi:hypothetical protein
VAALEGEVQQATAVIAVGETLLAAVYVPGHSLDKPLSAISAPTAGVTSCPYKIVRVRGVAWTNAGQFLTIRLRQGVGILGTAVAPAAGFTNMVSATGVVAVSDAPVPFEFVDFAPAGLNYTLTCSAGAGGTTVITNYSVTGYDG